MALAALAVQLTGDRITDQATPTFSRREVAQQLASDVSATSLAVPADASTLPPPDDGSAGLDLDASPAAPATATSAAPGPKPPSAAAPGGPATGGGPGPSPDAGPGAGGNGSGSTPGGPSPTTVTTISAVTQSWQLVGGQVSARCAGDVVTLVAAGPQPGFTAQVKNPGPQEVEVRFASAAHTSEFKVRCRAGVFQAEPRESDG